MKPSYSLYNEAWLKGTYYLKVVRYYYRHWQQYDMALHSHNQIEIMYVIRGQCQIKAEEHMYTLKKGDYILLDANVPHMLLVYKEETCRMLNIECVFEKTVGKCIAYGEIASAVPSVSSMLKMGKSHLKLKDTGEVYQGLHKIINELNQNKEQIMIQLLLMQVIIDISRQLMYIADDRIANKNIYVKKAIEYLYHHYDCDVRVVDIAKSINIHEGYLYRIFKQSTGKTMMAYLLEIRLDKARVMLENTDISISEITDYIGINSRQYFTYIFKKNYGITPRNYRKKFYPQE